MLNKKGLRYEVVELYKDENGETKSGETLEYVKTLKEAKKRARKIYKNSDRLEIMPEIMKFNEGGFLNYYRQRDGKFKEVL